MQYWVGEYVTQYLVRRKFPGKHGFRHINDHVIHGTKQQVMSFLILQMRKQKSREVKEHVQGHTAN